MQILAKLRWAQLAASTGCLLKNLKFQVTTATLDLGWIRRGLRAGQLSLWDGVFASFFAICFENHIWILDCHPKIMFRVKM